MNTHKIKLLIIICIAFSLKTFSQSSEGEQIATKFQQYVVGNFQEKMFVHIDRSFYLSGETMWFKIYNTDASTNQLSSISKIAYVELLNTDNKAVLQATIQLQEGTGNGQFSLPITLPTGNYTFRAYTNWMKNYSEEIAFHKIIGIVNVFEKNNDSINHTNKYDMQFFPEGGNLVKNIQSKIAFKAVNNVGEGISFQGKIVNQNNNVIVSFEPQKFGIGSFLFTPEADNTYKAIIITASNDTLSYNIPAIYDKGYVMLTETTEDFVTISVQANNNNSEKLYLVAYNNNTIQINQSQNLQNGKTVFNIHKASLKDGINYFTLFNSNNKPVCERLWYKRPVAKEFVKATINQPHFANREKVNIEVLSYNYQKQPIASNMSIAVFKTDELQPAESIDIQQYFWLTSNLKGNIENAGYYLNTISKQTDEALDNLLLTQGWRRFDWNNILQNTSPVKKYLPEYEGQLITGKVINKNTLTPVSSIGVFLSTSGKDFGFTAALSNNEGDFVAIMPKVINKSILVAQTNNRTDSNYRIDINSPYWNKESSFNLPYFTLHKKVESELNNYSINLQAENIYAKKPSVTQVLDYTPFYVKADESYLLDNYTRFTTMEEVMREYIPGVSVRKKSGKFTFYNIDAPRFQHFVTEPLILFDGIPVFDADKIIESNPLKVQKIDVVTRKFYYSSFAFDGIVSYTSYTGKMGTTVLDKESLLIDYDAIQQQREFYVPKYDLQENKESRLPDYRMLLHWSPNVITTTNGATNITFYTSDIEGNFTAIIQGLTQSGEPIKSSINFTVAK
ncbi:MAG: hypothetical protein KF781_06120 [Chitinophagaceae bacterium]|nr:hypothetical protein [Chitinophagaceae bacterium]MCW5906028.1 hypothetical protein [Chitinophagaceae bacterium]